MLILFLFAAYATFQRNECSPSDQVICRTYGDVRNFGAYLTYRCLLQRGDRP